MQITIDKLKDLIAIKEKLEELREDIRKVSCGCMFFPCVHGPASKEELKIGKEIHEWENKEWRIEKRMGKYEKGKMFIKGLALKKIRKEVLEKPQFLMGLKEPPIDALWGYIKGLTEAIDALEGYERDRWANFLKNKNYGSKSEYTLIQRTESFPLQLSYYKGLIEEYEQWCHSLKQWKSKINPQTMDFIVVDLEATCWRNDRKKQDECMEIIEFGAVRIKDGKIAVNVVDGKVEEDTFQSFVKPVIEPILTDYCTELTTITQEEVDSAPGYEEAFINFMNWIGDEDFVWSSWGQFDFNQIKKDCLRHNISFPDSLENHVNLKDVYVDVFNTKKRIGTRKAMRKLGLEFDGTQHRALVDALNISKIVEKIIEQM